jgi:hypothetical protein
VGRALDCDGLTFAAVPASISIRFAAISAAAVLVAETMSGVGQCFDSALITSNDPLRIPGSNATKVFLHLLRASRRRGTRLGTVVSIRERRDGNLRSRYSPVKYQRSSSAVI